MTKLYKVFTLPKANRTEIHEAMAELAYKYPFMFDKYSNRDGDGDIYILSVALPTAGREKKLEKELDGLNLFWMKFTAVSSGAKTSMDLFDLGPGHSLRVVK